MNKEIQYLEKLKEAIAKFEDILYKGNSTEVLKFRGYLTKLEAFISQVFADDKKDLINDLNAIHFKPIWFQENLTTLDYYDSFNEGRDELIIFIDKLISKIEFTQEFQTIKSNVVKEDKNELQGGTYSNTFGNGNTFGSNSVFIVNSTNSGSIFENMKNELNSSHIDESLKSNLQKILNEIQVNKEKNNTVGLKDNFKKFIKIAGSSLPNVLGIINGIIDLI